MQRQRDFTPRVRRVLYFAREEAARLHHDYLGTEHLLLGIVREGEGVAATVLRELAIDLDTVREHGRVVRRARQLQRLHEGDAVDAAGQDRARAGAGGGADPPSPVHRNGTPAAGARPRG